VESPGIDDAYWKDDRPDLRLNPGVAHPGPGLEEAVAGDLRLRGHVLFATSGSTGRSKIVCLAKAGVLLAAHWVNRHLDCDQGDRWLLALPQFHVGGYGLVARAWAAGGFLRIYRGRWEAARFWAEARESAATVTSLVPAQLHDLVVAGRRAPEALRMVVIGGGRLLPDMRERAVELGWPVRESYGMTETCAQIATQQATGDDPGWLSVIPDWRVAVRAGRIQVQGAPLLSGYLEPGDDGGWIFREARDPDGWFDTGDLGELDAQGRLRVSGRAGRIVKILGELVDLDRLDLLLAELCPERDSVLEPVEDPRAGWKIILVSEGEPSRIGRLLAVFNSRVAPFEQIAEVRKVAQLRRSELGKRLPQIEPDSKD
jgi:o-succinylbenzoate---CoA ligase